MCDRNYGDERASSRKVGNSVAFRNIPCVLQFVHSRVRDEIFIEALGPGVMILLGVIIIHLVIVVDR